MNDNTEDTWEMHVQQAAHQFTYPPTPNIAGQLRSRRQPRRLLQVALVLLLIALASMVAVPEIRASVLEFLRIGAVHIPQIEPTITNGTPTPLASVLDLPNETTLEQAHELVNFHVPLPAVGLPDRVFVQDNVFDLVTLVWLQPDAPNEIWFSLHILTSFGFAEKGYVQSIDETEVNGDWAVWLTEPHTIEIELSHNRLDDKLAWMIQHNVLLWENEGLTYRLEGDLTLTEARAIAESLE